MSKFDELCDAVEEHYKRSNKYQKDCYRFGEDLIGRMKKYLDIPNKNISYVPLDTDYNEAARYNFYGAIHLGEDSYWHVGVRILLSREIEKDYYPAILLRILFKKENNHYSVKLDNALDEKEFTILENNETDYIEYYDYVYSQIKKSFEGRLDRLLNKNEPIEVGFQVYG